VTGISVRYAQADDAEALGPLLATLGYPAGPEAIAGRLEAYLASQSTCLFVAEAGARLVGLAALHIMPLLHYPEPIGRISAFVVAEDYQRQGVGQTLLQQLEAHARAQGCRRIEVASAEHRTGAHRFYEHAGYQPSSRRFLKII
jgi:GNAT superfamily N-acetyltransferase